MIKQKAKIFQALSDPNRLKIVKMLSGKTLCVCEITVKLFLAPSTVSKHLSILRDAGFLSEEKRGKWVHYSLNTDTKDPLILNLLTLLNYELAGNDEAAVESAPETDIKCACPI